MSLVVYKLGGSVAFPAQGLNPKAVEFLKSLQAGKAAVVVGGGALLREYLKPLRSRFNQSFLDTIGIKFSRINAFVLAAHLKEGLYVETLEDAKRTVAMGKIPFMGGLAPGQSTDAVAAELAEYLEAEELRVYTNVDGVYDKDPRKHPDAKKFSKLSYQELLELVLPYSSKAADYPIFDFVAAKVIQRSAIKTIIGSLDGEGTIIG